jgi:hypothetical protein
MWRMEAPFDLEGLARDLAAFRDNVGFHLTNEPPIPADLAEPLWRAHESVVRTLEELSRRYNLAEDGWTIYAAEAKRPLT